MPPKRVTDPAMDVIVAKAGELALTNFCKRPQFGQKGRTIDVYANSYQVGAFPTSKVIQYDVQIGDVTTKRALIKKVWNSQAFKKHVGIQNWNAILFDGNKLAWSYAPLPFGNELNVQIDLAPEFGKRKPDIVRCHEEDHNHWPTGCSTMDCRQVGVKF